MPQKLIFEPLDDDWHTLRLNRFQVVDREHDVFRID